MSWFARMIAGWNRLWSKRSRKTKSRSLGVLRTLSIPSPSNGGVRGFGTDMIYAHNGTTYRIHFIHTNPATDPWREYNEDSRTYGTSAQLLKVLPDGTWESVGWGFSYLHPNDMYCKETGRRIALANLAFTVYPDDKASRSALWNAYWNRNAKPPMKEERVYA